jgi:hypothetical protein
MHRNTVERGLKHWRGIAFRYDKYALTYLGGVLLAAMVTYHRIRNWQTQLRDHAKGSVLEGTKSTRTPGTDEKPHDGQRARGLIKSGRSPAEVDPARFRAPLQP